MSQPARMQASVWWRWAVRPLALCLLSLLGYPLAGCQQAASSSTISVSQIISDAMNAPLTDATFTYTQINHWYGQNLDLQGTGYYTVSPKGLKFVDTGASGSPLDTQLFTDQTEYYLAAGQTLWKKIPSSSAQTMLDHFLNYAILNAPTLIGIEQIHGVAVYHIRGTIAGGLGPVTFDFWLSTTTFYPLQRATAITQGANAINVTDSFSAWDTGVTIPIPTNVSP